MTSCGQKLARHNCNSAECGDCRYGERPTRKQTVLEILVGGIVARVSLTADGATCEDRSGAEGSDEAGRQGDGRARGDGSRDAGRELGRVDEFWRADVFGIPLLNQT